MTEIFVEGKEPNWPPKGIKIKAVIRHCSTRGEQEIELLTVDEDDVSFRFEDGAELSYDWDVIKWEQI